MQPGGAPSGGGLPACCATTTCSNENHLSSEVSSSKPPPEKLVCELNRARGAAAAAATEAAAAVELEGRGSTEGVASPVTLRVGELHCAGCSNALHDALANLPGVSQVAVSIDWPHDDAGTARVWGVQLQPKVLIDAALGAGKPAELLQNPHAPPPPSPSSPPRLLPPVPAAPPATQLSSNEKEELAYLRRRVSELESAIGGLVVPDRSCDAASLPPCCCD